MPGAGWSGRAQERPVAVEEQGEERRRRRREGGGFHTRSMSRGKAKSAASAGGGASAEKGTPPAAGAAWRPPQERRTQVTALVRSPWDTALYAALAAPQTSRALRVAAPLRFDTGGTRLATGAAGFRARWRKASRP